MAKYIVPAVSSQPGSFPFLEDALETGVAVVGNYYEVLNVAESRKRSGFIARTEDFMVFCWKSDPICEALIQTVTYLCSINPSIALFIQPSNEAPEGYVLVTDDEVTRLWSHSKKNRVLELYSCQAVQPIPEVQKGRRTR